MTKNQQRWPWFQLCSYKNGRVGEGGQCLTALSNQLVRLLADIMKFKAAKLLFLVYAISSKVLD